MTAPISQDLIGSLNESAKAAHEDDFGALGRPEALDGLQRSRFRMQQPGQAAEAVEQSGKTGQILVTGLSTPNEMKRFVSNGTVKLGSVV